MKWIYPFHGISYNFALGVYSDTPPPIGQTVEKPSGFVHFMKFPAILVVQVHILTPLCVPMYMLKNYKVFKSQITQTQIALPWAIRMQEPRYILRDKTKSSKKNLIA